MQREQYLYPLISEHTLMTHDIPLPATEIHKLTKETVVEDERGLLHALQHIWWIPSLQGESSQVFEHFTSMDLIYAQYDNVQML